MRRIIALAVTLAVPLGGCSFVATRGPSSTSTNPPAYPDCTTSMTWPIVDGVFAALFTAGMIGAITDDGDMTAPIGTEPDDDDRAEAIASLGLFALATGVGAYVGYTRVSKCRGARERYQAAYPQGQPYGYPGGYPPQPYPPAQPYPGAPQPYPTAPQPYPAAPQPYYAPQPVQPVQPAQPVQPSRPVQPAQPVVPPASALGTEGDVCASNAECATGLTCSSNVCIRPAARPVGPAPAPGSGR